MDKITFCESFVHLDRELICFGGRPYLPDIYAVSDRNLVLRCSRQTEKSIFLVNTILYEACTKPGIKILFVSPRMEQARVFCQTRLLTSLEQSPLIRRTLFGDGKRKTALGNMQFENGSVLYTRAAYHSADSARGISADLLLIDEYPFAAKVLRFSLVILNARKTSTHFF